MRKYFTLCLVLAFMMVVSNDVYANLIKNGDFENFYNASGGLTSEGPSSWDVFRSLPGWNSGAAGIEVQHNKTVVEAQSGKYYVELDTDSKYGAPVTNSSMTQSLSSLGTGEYQLSFYYMPRVGKNGNNNPNDNEIRYFIDNDGYGKGLKSYNEGSSINLFREGNSAWSERTMTFVIGEGFGTDFNLTFQAFGYESSYGGLIDNVSLVKITPTPIPSSIALLLSGFAGFAALRRKKTMK